MPSVLFNTQLWFGLPDRAYSSRDTPCLSFLFCYNPLQVIVWCEFLWLVRTRSFAHFVEHWIATRSQWKLGYLPSQRLSRVSSRRSRHALQYTLLYTSVESNVMSALQKIASDLSESCVVIPRVLISARICLFSFFKIRHHFVFITSAGVSLVHLRHRKQGLESTMTTTANVGSGSGSRLPTAVLLLSGISTLVAVLVSTMSILLQLKSYRKPVLQRWALEANNKGT